MANKFQIGKHGGCHDCGMMQFDTRKQAIDHAKEFGHETYFEITTCEIFKGDKDE